MQIQTKEPVNGKCPKGWRKVGQFQLSGETPVCVKHPDVERVACTDAPTIGEARCQGITRSGNRLPVAGTMVPGDPVKPPSDPPADSPQSPSSAGGKGQGNRASVSVSSIFGLPVDETLLVAAAGAVALIFALRS